MLFRLKDVIDVVQLKQEDLKLKLGLDRSGNNIDIYFYKVNIKISKFYHSQNIYFY